MKSDGRTLLLVDADRQRLKALAETLTAAGHAVDAVHSGELALAAVALQPPCLVLLSVRLQDISGFEMFRLLQASANGRNVPVIFISDSAAVEERIQGFAMGAVDFLATDVSSEELLARVRTQAELGRVRLEAEDLLMRTASDLHTALDRLLAEAGERRRLEAAMRKSEQLALLAMQVGRTCAFEWSPRTGDMTYSADGAGLLGLTGDATAGKWTDYIARVHADDREGLLERIQELRPDYDTCECDYRLLPHDGRIVHLHAVIRGFFDGAGLSERYIGVVSDTTRARLAEVAMARSEERFRTMADAAPMMICASGPDKLATYFNRAWLSFTGRTMEEEVGDGWTEGVHADDLERAISSYSASFAAHRNCYLEYRLRRADGEYRWLACSGVPRWSADGVFAGYIASCIDITDLKLAQGDVFDRQKLESMRLLVGGIAHDLNNLMSAIQVQAELVEAEVAGGGSPDTAIRRLRGVASRAGEIVRELMVYSGEDKATLEPVNVSRVIDEMLELLKVSISKHARLGTDLVGDVPAVLANTTQIRQVVMNLVINASQAIGDKDGTIRIATSKVTISGEVSGNPAARPSEGDYVRLEIADTGSGMTEEARSRIFDRSFTTKVGGHGMGLAVVQGIVRSHGGVVNVTSALGHGTTFEVLLPSASGLAGRVPRIAPATAIDALNTGSKTVLLVEKEDHLRISVGKALRRRGFSMLSAADDHAALEVFRDRAGDIDVVVLDLPPHGASGLETLKQMRRLRNRVPVVLTGTTPESFTQGREAGVTFLRKPYRIAELLEALRNSIPADGRPEIAGAASD
jgi:two-component system cell cycle sensor histidine kinase/response regulator CckA